MIEFLQIIQIVLFLIACYLIYKYLPAYFTQKGKNLATKEDVGEITRIVEDVKSSFTKETEQLKANLQLLMSTRQSLATEERQALLDFHQIYYSWFTLCTDITFGNADTYKSEEIESYYGKLQGSYYQLLLSEAKLVLFIDNSELIELKDQLKMTTYQSLMPIVLRTKLALALNNIELERVKTQPQAIQTTEAPKIFEKRQAIIQTFTNELMEAIKTINPLLKEFQNKIARIPI